jgi:hypothetical protein
MGASQPGTGSAISSERQKRDAANMRINKTGTPGVQGFFFVISLIS